MFNRTCPIWFGKTINKGRLEWDFQRAQLMYKFTYETDEGLM